VIASLFFDHDMRNKDISEIFGVTEAAVSQAIRTVGKEIEKAALLSEKLSEYQDDPDYSKLCVDWITI
jgi:predicted transcriptional regulator